MLKNILRVTSKKGKNMLLSLIYLFHFKLDKSNFILVFKSNFSLVSREVRTIIDSSLIRNQDQLGQS